LANAITKDEALFVYIASAILGAFAGAYLARLIGPMSVGTPLTIEVIAATFGAIVLAIAINRALQD